MILGLEIALAVIATLRGHGAKPWLYGLLGLSVAFIIGAFLGTVMSNPYDAVDVASAFGLIVDVALIIVLGYLAFVPPKD